MGGSPVRLGAAAIGLSLAALLVACTKNSSSSGGELATSAAPSAAPVVEAAAPVVIEIWTGSYDSVPGSLYVFDGGEWAGVTWRGDEAGVGLGTGTLKLNVNEKKGEVHGTATGAIGDAIITGSIHDGSVAATVARKDASDRGLTGTLVATLAGSSLSGSMRLSTPDARILREAKFTLSGGKP